MSTNITAFDIDGFITDSLLKGASGFTIECSTAPTTFRHKRRSVCKVVVHGFGRIMDEFNLAGSDIKIDELTNKLQLLKNVGCIDNLMIGSTKSWLIIDRIII